MTYTPELDRAASGLVRQISRAAGRPMTTVLGELVLHAAAVGGFGEGLPLLPRHLAMRSMLFQGAPAIGRSRPSGSLQAVLI